MVVRLQALVSEVRPINRNPRALFLTSTPGLYIGVLSITSSALPLAKQATFTSLVGACYGLGATIGPVIGGTFTSKGKQVFLTVPLAS